MVKLNSSTTCEDVKAYLLDKTNIIDEVKEATSIITGANSGIGKETAKQLARLGGTVVLACRNLDKANAAIEDIRKETDETQNGVKGEDLKLVPMQLDLGDLVSVKKFSEEVKEAVKSEQLPKIRVIICNAGILPIKREVSAQNYEKCFAVNHLGHFYLTKLLIEDEELFSDNKLRLVAVSSQNSFGPYATKKIDDEKEMLTKVVGKDKAIPKMNFFYTYGTSKLLNILMVQSIAERITGGLHITTAAVCPGVVGGTSVVRSGSIFPILWKFMNLFSKNVNQGAATSFFASLAGNYDVSVSAVGLLKNCKPLKLPKLAQGDIGKDGRVILESISTDLIQEFESNID